MLRTRNHLKFGNFPMLAEQLPIFIDKEVFSQ